MVIVFALAAAVLYGSADFLGGAASRHSRALSVAVVRSPPEPRPPPPGWAGPSHRGASARSA